MRIIRHYITGSFLQNDSASCPRSAANEVASADAMVLTTAPQHNDAPHNAHSDLLTIIAIETIHPN
ncbi:hypothetical protein EAY42_24445, partial [Vibrio anguillarum]|nr:hypothetical protein [Vibrio anguillarum]